jgi:hypothetical protein
MFLKNFFAKILKFYSLFVLNFNNFFFKKVQPSGFELQILHEGNLKLKKSRHARLLHDFDKPVFIILYIHYVQKKIQN